VDRFRGRLIWPIRDLAGDVIAFGARKLDQRDDGPKYLNTPETPLFKKGAVLYGADLARREIGQRRQAVIVEGYTDVMACHLAGVPTAVATCGTSFGEGHIKIVRRLLMDASEFHGEVIFTFDGDAAGQRAALRAFSLEEKFVTQTFVAVQPDGLDPCDLRLKQGDGAVRDLVARRVPLYEFAIRSALRDFNLETAEGRVGALDAAARFIARIKDDALRKVYAGNLDRWLGLNDQELILRRIAGRLRGPGHPHFRPGRDNGRAGGGPAVLRPDSGLGQQATMTAGPAGRPGEGLGEQRYDLSDPVIQVEREVLKLAVQRPALCGPEFDALGDGAFTSARHTAVLALIAACGGAAATSGGRAWVEQLRERAPDDAVRSFVTELAVEALRVHRADGEADARYAAKVLARAEEFAVSRQITALKSRLQRMNPVEEQAAYNRMFGDLVALEQRRKSLLDRATGA
jgi:DNA primase